MPTTPAPLARPFHPRTGRRGVAVHVLGVALALAAAACGRYGLAEPWADAGDAPPTPNPGTDRPAQADLPPAADAPRELPGEAPPGVSCDPTPEICNGADDDCNGEIDDGIAPVACPGGGSRYCVAGTMSDCPQRCEACLPGGHRVCFTSYCTYWGQQTCAGDGRSFGPCREQLVPKECSDVAADKKKSKELEQCCLDNGYCCLDAFDLDGDGDRTEMIGRCDSVSCSR